MRYVKDNWLPLSRVFLDTPHKKTYGKTIQLCGIT